MADAGGGGASQQRKLSPFWFAVIVASVLTGIYAYQNQEKIFKAVNIGPATDPVQPSPPPPVVEGSVPAESPKLNPLQTIKIATWDLTPLDFDKLGDNSRAERIVETIMGFDVVAIQGIAMRNTLPVDELVRRLEAKNKHYAYAAYPESLGRVPEYMAFLFNKDTIRIDRETLSEIIDTSLTYRPLAANFCTAGPPPEKAFTFVLISVKIDEERCETEAKSLGNLYRTVRDRRSREDDIIMLGNFAQPIRMIDSLASVSNLAAVHPDHPTTADASSSSDNILFDRLRTTEYVERFEIVDLMTKYNLKIADIYPLAVHLPVVAEFSIFESGKAD